MNINVLLLHIKKSNLDEMIKLNLVTILNKAIRDGDTISQLEEITQVVQNFIDKLKMLKT